MTPPARRPASGRRTPGRGGDGGPGWERAGRARAARERADRTPPKDGARVRPDDGPPAVPNSRVPGGASAPGRRPGRGPQERGALATRYRRRRLTAALIGAVVLLVVVGLGSRVLLYDSGLANVEEVTVSGLVTVPEQVVRDAAAVSPGGPLISADTAGVAQRVASVEGVASVEVRRAWPHTVEIEVTERVPVALWQTAQGLFEVDTTGLPYRRAPEPPPALPHLVFAGVAPQDPATTAAITVLRDLTEPMRAQVATVDVAGTQVTLGLVDERSVRWGDPERSADKVAVLGPLLGQPGTVYDVSSPDLPTVRP